MGPFIQVTGLMIEGMDLVCLNLPMAMCSKAVGSITKNMETDLSCLQMAIQSSLLGLMVYLMEWLW